MKNSEAVSEAYAKLDRVAGEDKYVEWDDEYQCFAVFGDSGFCYSQHSSVEGAEEALNK